MSIPFSNTHYRIPRGFANLLEGLAREVLREQPQDIPNFAARYFAELLKKREESGLDPAEWGAALEDRYYNNHSFQHPEEKTFIARTDDVSSSGDGHLSQDFISSIREEGGHKFVEESALSAQKEDVSDRGKSVPVLESSEEPFEPKSRPSSSQIVEVEHKQDEERDANNLLRDQSATIIQAAFRGHQARDGVRKMKEEPGKNEGVIETPQVDSIDPQDGSVETRSLPDDDATTEGVSGGGTIRDQDLEARVGQNQEKEELKEDYTKNLIKDETEHHEVEQIQEENDNLASTQDVKGQDIREEDKEDNLVTAENMTGQECREQAKEDTLATPEYMEGQDHREEAKVDNLASTQDVEGPDLIEEAKEDNLATTEDLKGPDYRKEAKEDNMASIEDVEGQDHRKEAKEDNLASIEDVEGQDHRKEAKEDNLASIEDVEGQDHIKETKEDNLNLTEDDGDEEGKLIDSQGLEVAGDLSSEGTGSHMTQECHSHEAKMTEEQQESADNQDDETKEQPEAKEGEPADIMTPRQQHEGSEDPREENEALRKQMEEALDISLDDPDANAAAAKIQAGFRGHMTRKKMKSGDKDIKHKEGKEGTSAQGEHEGD